MTVTESLDRPRAAIATDAPVVRAYTVAAFAVSLLILVLRYPTAVFAPEFVWEDGRVLYLGGFDGLASLAQPAQGYLLLADRMVALAAAAIPPAFAPLLMNGATILVTAGVAAFIASDRLRTTVPDPRLRLALAVAFVLMPAAQNLSWHLIFLQWSLAFFLLARFFADQPGPRWIWLDRFAVGVAGLTGPFSILFAPLYLWQRRRLGAVTWIVVGCAIVELAFVATARHEGPVPATITEAVAIMATRLLATPLIGYQATLLLTQASIPWLAGGVFVVLVASLLVIAGSVIPRPTLAVLLYAALVVAMAGVVRAADSTSSLLTGWGGSRYFLFGVAAMMAIVIVSVAIGGRWQRTAGMALGILLVAGVVWDFRIQAPPTLGWAENSACIGGADPCLVPVYPGGDWDIRWPGR
jgi:hypothetical protein